MTPTDRMSLVLFMSFWLFTIPSRQKSSQNRWCITYPVMNPINHCLDKKQVDQKTHVGSLHHYSIIFWISIRKQNFVNNYEVHLPERVSSSFITDSVHLSLHYVMLMLRYNNGNGIFIYISMLQHDNTMARRCWILHGSALRHDSVQEFHSGDCGKDAYAQLWL